MELGRVLVGVAAVAVAAQLAVPVPGTPVPQSLQTLAVVLVGAWLGPGMGALALALYIVVGAFGLPVFADGAAGAAHLTGPTLGYLLGFVAGAALMGWWVRRAWGRGVVGAFAGAVVVHAVILIFGGLRLGTMVGATAAFESGVEPFLIGGLVKSVVATAAWVAIRPPSGLGPDPDRGTGAGDADGEGSSSGDADRSG